MSKDLRHFLDAVRSMGPDYYVEVKKRLRPQFEVCVLQQKLAKGGRYPAIYCSAIEGSELPLVTNLFGSYEMLGLALGLDPKKVRRAEIARHYRAKEKDLKPVRMVSGSEAPVKEVILRGNEADLGLLPIPHHAERDSGRYITVGCLVCQDPDGGVLNVGIYRHEVKGKNQLGFMVSPTHHAAYIARRHAELGKPMEVAIFIGHHPAVGIGACAGGSLGSSELEIMGGLLGEPLRMTRGETIDLPVPADSEIVVEGTVDPTQMTADGPFAEYTGYYGEGNKRCYLINVSGITMRSDAIYHDLDPAHREHNLMDVLGLESNLYERVKQVIPTLQDVHIPQSGSCVFHIYLSMKKAVPGEGRLAGMAGLSADPNHKLAIVVDEDIDVYDEQEVLWAVATRVQGDQAISVIPSVAGAHLDPSAYDEARRGRGNMTTKMIIDATKPVSSPFAARITPPEDVWQTINIGDYID